MVKSIIKLLKTLQFNGQFPLLFHSMDWKHKLRQDHRHDNSE